MEHQEILAPVDDANPCGMELDYDPDYLALERSLSGQPERQYGDTIIPAEAPDWPKAMADAQKLLKRSKDFRLTAILTRSLARTRGIAGALEGIRLNLEMAHCYWDEAHPALAFDGEHDPVPRGNALATLTAHDGLLSDLRTAEIPTRQLGAISLGTIERIHSGRESDANKPLRREQLIQLIAEESNTGNAVLRELQQLRDAADELDQLCQERLGPEASPDFQPLFGLIDLALPQQFPASHAQPAAMDKNTTAAPVEASLPATPLPHEAKSRADVIRMLDAACAYLEQTEPANPAPLLIRRARQLIGQDFLSILRELAPDGLPQATLIAGSGKRD